MSTETSLAEYYARRAREYERIYARPERQADLATLREWVLEFGRGRRVLEHACGTGWWTRVLSESAESILALDINEEVLDVARAKPLPRARFLRHDVYSGSTLPGHFDAGLAGFWWSHVPRSRLPEFLKCFHRLLQPDATVLFLDNRFVDGSSTPICRRDADGNTFQTRQLENGDSYEVLKNFPEPDELRAAVQTVGVEPEVRTLTHYWCLTYRIPERSSGEASPVSVPFNPLAQPSSSP